MWAYELYQRCPLTWIVQRGSPYQTVTVLLLEILNRVPKKSWKLTFPKKLNSPCMKLIYSATCLPVLWAKTCIFRKAVEKNLESQYLSYILCILWFLIEPIDIYIYDLSKCIVYWIIYLEMMQTRLIIYCTYYMRKVCAGRMTWSLFSRHELTVVGLQM